VPEGVADPVEQFEPVSLEELDERAALLKRVDHKYALQREQFAQLLERLRSDHQVLEIDGQRMFEYRSTYFDTPDLRCFTDHVEDRRPRFKVRTRCYVDTGGCMFEVKLKRGDGETDKRQIDYSSEQRCELTEAAVECLNRTLRDAQLEPPERMEPGISTSFHRVTFAAASGSERLTCDLGVTLGAQDGASAALREGLVLVETKTEHGESPADAALAEMGLEPISLSKYRVGMGLVGPERAHDAQPGSQFFERL
jgi:hypothetical protein